MSTISNVFKAVIYGKQPPNSQYLAGSIFRGISKSSDLGVLVAFWPKNDAFGVKIEVLTHVAAHCLFMREVAKYHPRYDSAQLFNGMSDESKRLLAMSSIRPTSPVEIFPNTEQRHVIAGLFLGRAAADSQECSITADRLFGMLLSFYVGRFFQVMDGLKVGRLSFLETPRAAKAVGVFLMYGALDGLDSVPPGLHEKCEILGATMVGIVSAAIGASPIR